MNKILTNIIFALLTNPVIAMDNICNFLDSTSKESIYRNVIESYMNKPISINLDEVIKDVKTNIEFTIPNIDLTIPRMEIIFEIENLFQIIMPKKTPQNNMANIKLLQ